MNEVLLHPPIQPSSWGIQISKGSIVFVETNDQPIPELPPENYIFHPKNSITKIKFMANKNKLTTMIEISNDASSDDQENSEDEEMPEKQKEQKQVHISVKHRDFEKYFSEFDNLSNVPLIQRKKRHHYQQKLTHPVSARPGKEWNQQLSGYSAKKPIAHSFNNWGSRAPKGIPKQKPVSPMQNNRQLASCGMEFLIKKVPEQKHNKSFNYIQDQQRRDDEFLKPASNNSYDQLPDNRGSSQNLFTFNFYNLDFQPFCQQNNYIANKYKRKRYTPVPREPELLICPYTFNFLRNREVQPYEILCEGKVTHALRNFVGKEFKVSIAHLGPPIQNESDNVFANPEWERFGLHVSSLIESSKVFHKIILCSSNELTIAYLKPNIESENNPTDMNHYTNLFNYLVSKEKLGVFSYERIENERQKQKAYLYPLSKNKNLLRDLEMYLVNNNFPPANHRPDMLLMLVLSESVTN